MTGSTDFNIKSLGPCRIPSPLKLELEDGTPYFNFVSDETKNLYEVEKTNESGSDIAFEKAGPGKTLLQSIENPAQELVPCGGLLSGNQKL
jgi:hypothetical protein